VLDQDSLVESLQLENNNQMINIDFNKMYKGIKRELKLKKKVENIFKKYPLPKQKS